MSLFSRLFGGAQPRRITLKNPLVIKSPTIGFLNLIGPDARPIIDEDRSALSGIFSREITNEEEILHCDVLFVYAVITSDGLIEGKGARLRDIVNQTGASIVVFASENDPKGYIAAGRQTRARNVNLVLTVQRKGKAFTKFFVELFGAMGSGTTMPLAWVKLAPQGPGPHHDELPSTIFSAEISHIIFK